MNLQDRITVDPAILTGKPIVRGTRISVEFLMDLLAQGWTKEQILTNYPQLHSDDIQAVLQYAADSVKQERIYPISA